MTKALKKLFGGIELTWPKLIIAAVIAGAFTALMALIPALEYTSFHTIAVLRRFIGLMSNTESGD